MKSLLEDINDIFLNECGCMFDRFGSDTPPPSDVEEPEIKVIKIEDGDEPEEETGRFEIKLDNPLDDEDDKVLDDRGEIEGGVGDDLDLSSVDPNELEMGEEIEKEHIKNNPKMSDEEKFVFAQDIAKDHLKEVPDYYTKLKKYVEPANESEALTPAMREINRRTGQAMIKRAEQWYLFRVRELGKIKKVNPKSFDTKLRKAREITYKKIKSARKLMGR